MFSLGSVVCAGSVDNSTGVDNTDSISADNSMDTNTVISSVSKNNYENKNIKQKTTGSNSKSIKHDQASTSVTTSDVNCTYGEMTSIPVEFTSTPDDGMVSLYIDDNLYDAHNLSTDTGSFDYDGRSYGPGVYNMYVDYSGSNIYSNCGDDSHSLTVYDDSILSGDKLNISFDRYTCNSTCITFNADAGSCYADYNPVSLSDASIDFYINDVLVSSTDYGTDSCNVDITSSMIDNLSVGCYNWTAVYSNSNTYLRSSSVSGTLTVYESRPVMLSTGSIYTCNAGSVVAIPVDFNSSVSDGVLSLSYGGSTDYTVNVNSSNMTVYFDTDGYLPGEYNLIVNYTDSLNYGNTSTSTVLRIYQPTEIRADRNSVNYIIGENSSVIFTTGYDVNNEIISGSVDLYVDDTLTDTFMVDSETGNMLSVVLDDDLLGDIKPGKHTLKALFTTGNEFYPDSSVNIDLNVNGSVELMVMNPVRTNVSSIVDVLFNATCNGMDIGTGVVEFYLDNTSIGYVDLDSSPACFSIDTGNMSTGSHELVLKYADNVYEDSVTSSVLELYSPTIINSSILSSDVSNTTLDIMLCDYYGNLFDANISVITPDGSIIHTGSVNHVAHVYLDNLTAGSNRFIILFDGMNYYNSANSSVTVNVLKLNSTINVNILNNTVDNASISIGVFDKKRGTRVESGNITVMDDNNNTLVNTALISDGNLVIPLDMVSGNYLLHVYYTGNSYYNTSTADYNISIVKRSVSIDPVIVNSTYGNTSINVNVRDSVTGNPISNANLVINNNINITCNINGSCNIKLDLPVGTNDIIISYPETSKYKQSDIHLTINITKRNSKIIAQINNNTIGNTDLKIEVHDKTTDKIITNGQITIKYTNNTTITTKNINGSTTRIPLNITKETNKLIIEYNGNTNYNPSNTTINTNLKGRNVIINHTINNNTIDNTTITVNILDKETLTPIDNQNITITLPDNTNITVNSKTKLDLPAGNNTIKIKYPGNNIYNPSIKEVNITVEKIATIITVKNKISTLGETILLEAHITDMYKNNITGGQIVFKINDNTIRNNTKTIYVQVTNSTATLEYKIPVNYQSKTYKLTAVYSGTDKYKNTRSTAGRLNIKKRNLRMTLTTNTSTAKIDQTIQLQVNTHDKNNIVNGYIILKIDGKTIKDKNNKTIMIKLENNTCNYNYTIPHNIASKKHKITALLVNNTYNRCQKDIQMQVNKTTIRAQINNTIQDNTITLTGQLLDEHNHTTQGINKACIKINGKTLKDDKNKTIGYKIIDGKINITIRIPEKLNTKIQNITLVTGERYTYNKLQVIMKINTTRTMKTMKTKTNKQYITIKPKTLITQINTETKLIQTIKDQYNNKVNTGNIIYNIENRTIQTKVKSGESILHYNFTREGIYNITATYTNSSKYYKSMTKFEIKAVDPRPKSMIKTTDITTQINQKTNIPLIIQDEYKNIITTGNITIKINTQPMKTMTINTSTTTYTTTFNKEGEYNLTITYNDIKYKPSTKTVKIKVKKINTKTIIDKINTTQITIHVTTNKTVPVNEGYIIYKINGKTVKENNKTRKINVENGIITIKQNIPSSWIKKKYTLTVVYSGTENLETSRQTVNFNIKQQTPVLKIERMTSKTDKTITLTATVSDKTSKATSVFKINGKTVKDQYKNKLATIKNGTITLKYKIPHHSAKNYKITCVYNNKQTRIENTTILTITKQNTKIKPEKFKKSKKTLITASILDEDNKQVTGTTKITIKINNKTMINKIRINNGKISQKLDTSHAKSLTIIAGENSWYKTSKINIKI